ncbi:alpha-L-rhamnosidase-related protein [Tamlana flava]|uniref:alpha-L-rhamnosidase-related protein n=1 Tax=Tamlana flava TaxID=3158572 RepID=UPI00351BA088
MKIFKHTLLFLLGSFSLLAQEINEVKTSDNLIDWKANWIWQDVDGPKDTWMCFRKTVNLTSKLSKAIARISTDSKYWLWINGELVVFEGQLKRDRLDETYYDELNLAPYLRTGKNTIAVLVWFWGREGFSHHDSGKGGFLFNGNFGDTPVVSDATWKTQIHPAYEHSTNGGQPNMRLSVWNVRFNAKNDLIKGWQQPDFDDSHWSSAIEKGRPKVPPWSSLVKRPFPQWKDYGLKAYSDTKENSISDTLRILEGIMPYNTRVSAYLKIKAPKGKLINIQTDQYDGWYDFGEGPANRAEYITKEGIQEFETLAWMSGNSVKYSIPKDVEVISLKYREIGYPSEFAGAFSCDDPFYEKLWNMARRTLYINMFDNFMDCPDRERALWWGDVVNQSGECFYALDTTSHALIKKSIKTLVAWQRKDSTLLSPTSTLWRAELPQQMLASIGHYGFWNYFMNTNDSTTIRNAYPSVRKYLGIWKMKENGLVQHRTGAWDWGDWGTNIDIDILDNTWYYLALMAAIPMAKMSGFNEDTANYAKRMKSIEDNFSKVFWIENEQHFGSKNLTIPDDRANAMAVVSGLAKPEQFPGVKNVLENQIFASPYLEKYVLEALCLIGSESIALDRMKERYSEMVEGPYSTLWEVWSGLKEGTINHGWNAPNTVLSQNIAGLSPLQPGWSKYQVLPRMGRLTEVSQTVQTVKGNIEVSHKVTVDSFVMNLKSPENTKAVIGIPNNKKIKSISANGKIVWKNGKYRNKMIGISSNKDDSNFIQFEVDSGIWTFMADFN